MDSGPRVIGHVPLRLIHSSMACCRYDIAGQHTIVLFWKMVRCHCVVVGRRVEYVIPDFS